jgi:hypothetical protein
MLAGVAETVRAGAVVGTVGLRRPDDEGRNGDTDGSDTSPIPWGSPTLVSTHPFLFELVTSAKDREDGAGAYGPWTDWQPEVRALRGSARGKLTPSFGRWIRWALDPPSVRPKALQSVPKSTLEPAATAIERLEQVIRRSIDEVDPGRAFPRAWSTAIAYVLFTLGVAAGVSVWFWHDHSGGGTSGWLTFFVALTGFVLLAAVAAWRAQRFHPPWWGTRTVLLVSSASVAGLILGLSTSPGPVLLALAGLALVVFGATLANLTSELLHAIGALQRSRAVALQDPGPLLVVSLTTALIRLSDYPPYERASVNYVLDPLREAALALERAMRAPDRCRKFDPAWAADLPLRVSAPLRQAMQKVWQWNAHTAEEVAELCRTTLDLVLLGRWGDLPESEPPPAPPRRSWWRLALQLGLGVGPLIVVSVLKLSGVDVAGWLWVPVVSLAVAAIATATNADVQGVIDRASAIENVIGKPT